MGGSAPGGNPAVFMILKEAEKLVAQGRHADAEKVYRRVLAMDPDNPEAAQMIGVLTYQRGDKPRGKALVEEALKKSPSDYGTLLSYGVIVHYEGDNERAAQLFLQAIEANPRGDRAYHHYGYALNALGRHAEAEQALRKAVELKPGHAEAHFSLGNALQFQGKAKEALEAYRLALELRPNYPEALTNLGSLLLSLGEHRQAAQTYEKAIAANPRAALPYANLGTTALYAGDTAEAEKWFRKALEVDSNSADGWFGLGSLRQQTGQMEAAIEAFDAALRLRPGEAKSIVRKVQAMQELGLADDALSFLKPFLEAPNPPDELRVLEALVQPLILKSKEEIREVRKRVKAGLEDLIERGVSLPMPEKQIGMTSFYLGYHGENEIEFQKLFANMYLGACPDLGFVAPHCKADAIAGRQEGGRIRLGVASAFLYEHPVGVIFGPLIQRLDRDKFEVLLFRAYGKTDGLSKEISASADETIELPRDLALARAMIAEKRLDVLFYPEIGADPFTYFLAFSRLAPVQALTWGHVSTTGLPNMDYFLSGPDLQGRDPQGQYTETLVCLPGMATYYERPAEPPEAASRAKFGLPEDAHLYVCPQSLFKIHPEYDAVLAEILERDPKALLVFVSGRFPTHEKLLAERFERSSPGMTQRVRFLRQMPIQDFYNLYRVADALLDPFHFGGGKTSMEALSFGCPIVTCPADLLRTRITYAWYRKIGVLDLVAESPEEYVELSVRLANDKDWRNALSAKILEGNHVMFENEQAIREVESFFVAAHRAALEGRRLGRRSWSSSSKSMEPASGRDERDE